MEIAMRRSVAVLAMATVGVLALAGCAAPGEEAEEGGDVTITYSAWTPEQSAFDEIAAGFTDENPNITVTGSLAPYADYLAALRTELAAGAGPDVYVLEPGALMDQFKELIAPVEELTEDDSWKDDYIESALAGATVDGTVLGLPTGVNAAGFLWVNESLLASNGLDVPTNYDELVDASAALTAAGFAGVAYGGKDTWQNLDYFMAMANSIDSDGLYSALDGDGSWETDELVEAFERFKGIFDDGVTQSGATGAATYMDALNLFLDGKAAFYASGTWELGLYVGESVKEKFGAFDSTIIPFPAGDGESFVTADASSILVVNKNSEHKEEALAFIEYMSRGAGAQVLADAFIMNQPTKDATGPSSLTPEASATRDKIVGFIDTNLAGYRQLRNVDVKEALSSALTELMIGSITPEEAAERVQAASDES
jgi:raffinose/stachyose/melibiose transport system substrate-binding protein